MADKRIYVVTEGTSDGTKQGEFMVKASSQAQAVAHVVKGRFSAEVASTDDVVRLMGAGATVQDTGGSDGEPAPAN